jgi:hypothetical protein
MQRLYVARHGTLGSCVRDALLEGNAYVVACLHVSLLIHVHTEWHEGG